MSKQSTKASSIKNKIDNASKVVNGKKLQPVQIAVVKVSDSQYDFISLNYDIEYSYKVNGRTAKKVISNEPFMRLLAYEKKSVKSKYQFVCTQTFTFNPNEPGNVVESNSLEFIYKQIDLYINILSNDLIFKHQMGEIKLRPKKAYKISEALSNSEIKDLIKMQEKGNGKS